MWSAVALVGTASLAEAADAPFALDDLRKIVSVGAPRISPDGHEIAVIVAHSDWKADENRQEIDLVDVATGALRVLTRGREGL
ncbi:MAG TPA: hypothetical protein VKC62_09780, partial [Gaiellaceae bacterium]|nr:hypothetical protein [Gaiellaceae bacterium]